MDEISQLQALIDASRNMVFFSGAGVSTESGLMDFRGEDGAYNCPSEIPLEQVYSHQFFMERPVDFYRVYRERIRCPSARPNAAHRALAALERAGRLRAVITQNTDNLHQDAGSRNVIELHGSVYRNYCTLCGAFHDLGHMIYHSGTDGLPRCTRCGGLIKPGVVLYEEAVPPKVKTAARQAIAAADLLVVAGSSLRVYPAAGLINDFAGQQLVIINRSPTPFDTRAALILRGDVGAVLSQIEVKPCVTAG